MKIKIDSDWILGQQENRIKNFDAKTYTKKLLKHLTIIAAATLGITIFTLIILGFIYKRMDLSMLLIAIVFCLLLVNIFFQHRKKIKKKAAEKQEDRWRWI